MIAKLVKDRVAVSGFGMKGKVKRDTTSLGGGTKQLKGKKKNAQCC